MNVPQHGQVISFTKAPAGSYASEGVAYRVERPQGKGDVRLVNVAKGSSTYDRPWAFARAEWSVVQG